MVESAGLMQRIAQIHPGNGGDGKPAGVANQPQHRDIAPLPGDFIGPVNLGNPSEFSMLELAEKIIDMTHSQSKIVYGPLPPDDPMQRRPDIALAKEKLKWEPEIDLEEGLKKTIAYFKN